MKKILSTAAALALTCAISIGQTLAVHNLHILPQLEHGLQILLGLTGDCARK